MMSSYTKHLLSNIDQKISDQILTKFKLICPDDYSVEEKLKVMRCNILFNKHLQLYKNNEIHVILDKKGHFHDLKSVDNVIPGIFTKSPEYPCSVCHLDVTNKNDDSGYGMLCCGCDLFFHNSCNSSPVSHKLFDALKDSPPYIRIFCPNCMVVVENVSTKLDSLNENIEDVKTVLKSPTFSHTCSPTCSPSSYSEAISSVASSSTSPPLKIYSKKSKLDPDNTFVISGVKNSEILKSGVKIRAEISKHFPRIKINKAFSSPTGKIYVQLSNSHDILNVLSTWKSNFLGDNTTCHKLGSNIIGIAKNVSREITDETLQSEIEKQFPDSTVHRMKKDNRPLNTIKITFNSNTQLSEAMKSGLNVEYLHLSVEEYQPQTSEPLRCFKCQQFHKCTSFICKNSPKCGYCASSDYKYSDCPHKSNESLAKCVNCNLNHPSNSKSCRIYLDKKELLASKHSDIIILP